MLRDYFNEKAATWDKTAAEKDTAKLLKLAAELSLKTGDTVLDVGTGTGVFLPYILEKIGENGFVYALDIAEKMLAQAKMKYPRPNIKYICGSVEEIPLNDRVCEAVICYSSFPHFQDKALALREMKRVLKSGGVLYIAHSSNREHINHIHSRIEAARHDLLPDAMEMTQLLLKAGFTGVKVSETPESYTASGKTIG
ncbi:MAG: methyltransferase domain-containing protein [Dehalococcoidales bacterium]|nr:methyltransferase domain-containing protein [Dehalococcoidales bacterium]